MVSFQGATTRAGWFTGTVTIQESISGHTMFATVTAMDNRNAAGTSGTISLVSPLLLWSYNGMGGSVTFIRLGFASYSRLSLRFLPEPARLWLLAAGIFGLAALSRWTRPRHAR